MYIEFLLDFRPVYERVTLHVTLMLTDQLRWTTPDVKYT